MDLTHRATGMSRFIAAFFLSLCLLTGLTAKADTIEISGSLTTCPATTNVFIALTDATNASPVYSWTFSTNDAGAVILGDTNQPTVEVISGTNGSFSLALSITTTSAVLNAETTIAILEPASASPLTPQIVCPGSDVTFSTTPAGTGPFSFLWRKDTVLIADATNSSISLTNVSALDAGQYCVEVTGACGSITNCAMLSFIPPAIINCPTGIVVECLGDVPAPDTNLVSATGAVSILYLGDNAVTNGCEIVIARTYAAINSCNVTSTCNQTITVIDTTPPVLTPASSHAVECGSPWDFDAPSVFDNCLGTNVPVVVLNTLTNPLCGATFSATRTWLATDACGNTNTCSQTITVIDTTAPVITCASNRVVECSAAWDFDPPSITDACDTNSLLTISGTITNAHCGKTFTATRTWLVTDACGNTNSCSQTIDVVDTTPPVMVCASNRVVECTAAWDFETPNVSDACDPTNFTLVVTSTTTNNHCGVTFTAIRTWLATDACGNTNSCSQTIDVVDTTAPVLTCSSNILVECTGPAGTPVNFTVTASDACDTNVIVYTIPPSGSAFTLGTNTVQAFAYDFCGNTNTCSFTVTVVDTTPPTIACPANIIAAEQPRDSGSAPVTYAAPVVGDICDASLGLITYPPSGFAFPVGTNIVNALVSDDSGNSNSCSFTVRVIPYRLYVTNLADAGPGTFRQALLDANDAPGENLVLFNLAGPGVHTISLESALPEITSPIIINGSSQPGYTSTPIVEITGVGMTNRVDGLVISAGQSTVRSLILNGFATALKLISNGTNVIQNNFIGTDATGTNIVANTGDGIYITCGPNLIGGTTNSSGNVIAGNGGSGIHLDGPAATLNLIRGNFIGVGLDGLTPAGNTVDGVRLENAASKNSLGAPVLLATNIIAFNSRNGVTLELTAGTQNSIFANLIHDNGALNIDLGNDGPTGNDNDDPDSGPNQLQNAPVLTDARYDGGLVIEGILNSSPNTNFRLDFWLSNTTNGQNQIYLGSTTVSIGGSGNQTFAVGFATSAVYTQYVTATAIDASGNSSEFSVPRQVRTPPVLESVPVSTNSAAGGSVVFCATASGTPPIFFQWRHNGEKIPGATNQCYSIPLAQIGDGGTYSVVVYNILGGSLTPPARLFLNVGNAVAAGDNFVDRVTLVGRTNQVAGSNHGATRETGEPLHAGKPGGKSVWYTWTAPITGIATFGTTGSDFDTLLGVYTGTNVAFLIPEGSDEDSGGYFTSGLRFNAIKNRQYHFAIDGYGGEEGDFIFGWQMEDTPHLLPVIITQPDSQTVALGDPVTFTVVAVRQCGGGKKGCPDPTHYPHDQLPGLSVQWFFEGNLIPGAINYSLTLSNVQPANVGKYTARVTAKFDQDGVDRTVESLAADLQINSTGDGFEAIQAKDKLLDALLSDPWIIGNEGNNRPAGRGYSLLANSVVRGYTGTQIFNTAGSTTSIAEDPICGVLGGSSEWITFVAVESGDLFLNTDGSSYDTVMAVFLRNPSNPALLTQVACNNNGGIDGIDSSLTLPVTVGQTNAILIDGVNGASGTLKLNYSLVPKVTVNLLGFTPDKKNSLRVTGRTNLNFSLQRSTDLINWSTILTTNAPTGIFNYLDPSTGSQQFYRARALP